LAFFTARCDAPPRHFDRSEAKRRNPLLDAPFLERFFCASGNALRTSLPNGNTRRNACFLLESHDFLLESHDFPFESHDFPSENLGFAVKALVFSAETTPFSVKGNKANAFAGGAEKKGRRAKCV
jgi:hypothetical protein